MRLIGSFKKENIAKKFSYLLEKEGVGNTLDMNINTKEETFSYLVWAHNEDELDKATELYDEFIKNPEDAKYLVPINQIFEKEAPINSEEEDPLEGLKKIKPTVSPGAFQAPVQGGVFKSRITGIMFLICVMVFSINLFQQEAYRKKQDLNHY